jgi:soluble lytic murein transglycosylase-like protein
VDWIPVAWNTAIGALRTTRILRLHRLWISFARVCSPRRLPALALAALLTAGASAPATAAVGAQQDPELRAVLQQAIGAAQCFSDRFDSAVWYQMMEPKLRRYVADRAERMALLTNVWCESRRAGKAPLQPGLVLAVIDVESAFNRWAVSGAGAVGVMQVMPFWPQQLGMRRNQLSDVDANIRMGCAILRYYLQVERNDFHRALARYNGSVGSRKYSNVVVDRWTRRWNGADDLARNSPLVAR